MMRLAPWVLLTLTFGCAKDQGRPAAPDTSAPPPAASEFSFRSPAAGDTLVEGRSYTIRWSAYPARRIDLGAAMGGHDKGLLLHDAPAGLDSLVWTVPIGFVTGFGPPSSDQIRLRLTNADSTDQWVEVGPFVIVGAPAPHP